MSPQVLVRLDYSLGEELDRMARSLGVSRAELIRIALRHFLGIEPDGEEVRKALRDLGEYAGLIMYLASLDYEVGRRFA